MRDDGSGFVFGKMRRTSYGFSGCRSWFVSMISGVMIHLTTLEIVMGCWSPGRD